MTKLKSEDYQQMLDRIKVISNVVDNNLQQHPVAKIHTNIKDHISAAVDELYKAAEIVKKNC
jgi:ribulose 1,5-bisphosphate carboxylase large subunit-like protein